MLDSEHLPSELHVPLCKVLIIPELVPYLTKKIFISFILKHTNLVQNRENAHRLTFNQGKHLLIIWEVNRLPIQPLLGIELLFQRKHMLVKLLLQLFIGVINTKLFKRIILENLKPEDI